jgi:hypothetical protein
MQQLILTILLWLGFIVPPSPVQVERPIVNIPLACRESNWETNSGSCVHASMIALFRWQGRFGMADYWRRAYGGGENPDGLVEKFERQKIRYAYVTNGDVSFLEWAVKTRRGCGVVVKGGSHMVCLLALDDKYACLLDNNRIEKFIWVPRESFLAEWKASDGWAVTILYPPAAPLPY